MNFYQTMLALPWILFHWKQQSREIRNCHRKRYSGPHPALVFTQSCYQHQPGKSWTFYIDWLLTWNRQLIHQKLHIIGNNLGETKTCGAGERNTPTIFPEDWTVTPRRASGITSSKLHQNPLYRQVKVVHVLLDVRWTTPGLCADKKPAGQNSKDQPSLKETTTDCESFVASNRLPKARLGYQLTLPGLDPEGEDSRQTRLTWDEFHHILYLYLHYFSFWIAF